MAEAKGPKTQKGREAAAESWPRGAQVMRRVMGMKLPAEKPEGVGPYLEATVEDLFANVWSREGALSVRDRRLLVMAVVTCMGQQEYLKLHLEQAYRQGELSPEEIEEIATQLCYYAGWPRGSLFQMTAREVFAEALADGKGGSERGGDR
ncbi:MAG: carboxymuconolactone decarboxylase family protein [Deltaproteobacteria bacterium]|nr:carboxymuconolactone decarboxylase family protein [Deltaproteobacteria bacterium]